MQHVETAAKVSVPPEWAPQKAIWTAWPADANEWNGDLEAPRRDVAALVNALAPGNAVRVLVNGAGAEASARVALGSAADVVPAKYGDIWLRDTGPIFARTPDGAVALRFTTNGWGGKYELPDDDTVGDEIARPPARPVRRFDFVLEGGALDHDGDGTVLTTRQWLLNPNRNRLDQGATPRRARRGARRHEGDLAGRGPARTTTPTATSTTSPASSRRAASCARPLPAPTTPTPPLYDASPRTLARRPTRAGAG